MDDTDKTAEPAAAVAKRVPGADFDSSEPNSPINRDGSIRWNAERAARAFADFRDATCRDEDARRDAEAVRIARVRDFLPDH